MKIEVVDAQRGGIQLVKIEGRLDANFSLQLEDEVDRLLDQGKRSIILDLSDVTYLSSSGLRVFLSINQETKGTGGLVLVNPREVVKKIFEVAELQDLLTQAETVEEALTILEAEGKS
jgi:anti-sigma B factor antagonist